MNKKRVTFYIDSSIYDEYRKQCKQECFTISRRVENLIKKDLNELKK